jgi:hypothetical protein
MPTTRLLNLDEYPLAAEFLNEHWAKNHIYTRDKSLFDWTFRRKGFSENQYTFAVAEESGQIVGVLGGIPFNFNRFGQSIPGFWLANWKVREEFRRGTTALELLNHFYQPKQSVAISFGINPTVAKIYQAMRWRMLEDIPRYFAVLPGAESRMENLLQIAWPNWENDRRRRLAHAFAAKTIIPSFSKTEPLDWRQWDPLGWNPLKNQIIGAARDGDYLQWRYDLHPMFKYQLIIARENIRLGLAAWRVETIRRRSGDQLVDVDRIVRLVEFLPVSPENAAELIGRVFAAALEADAFAVDGYFCHGLFGQYLAENGLAPTDACPDGRFIPSRFQPLDDADGRIMSAVSFSPDPPPSPTPDCPWHWTKSDSDQDRPN